MRIRAPQLWSGFLLSLFCAVALAQTSTGSVYGTVSDQAGAVLPQAGVVVRQVSTNIERRLTTNSEGVYNADNLQPGEYEVRVEVAGFQRQLRRITVQTGANAEVDFSLPASGSAETVVITSEAPQINTTDYKIDGIITRERIEALPLNGRNFLELAQLEPGVTVETRGNPGQSANAFTTVSIGGIAFGNGGTRISVDGATVNDRVTGGSAQNFSQETVQEFQINTANFDLANSVTSFGSINIVSRGGGNDFHGSGFFFFRDHNISAYPNLRRNPRNPDPFFARRQSGFTLSGPIQKNKLFWFVNYEYNNTVSVSEVSQNVTTGDGGALAANFNHIGQAPLRGKLFNARLDWKVSDHHTAFLRYSEDYNTSFAFNGENESNWNKSRNSAYNPVIGVTSVLSPRIVNEFRYNWGMLFNAFSPPTPEECGSSVGCIGAGGPLFTIADVSFTMGTPTISPTDRANRIYQLSDIVSWTKGVHRIRFGFEHERYVRFGSQSLANQGTITLFSPQQMLTARPDLHTALPASLRSPAAGPITLADILRLPFSTFSVGVGEPSSPPPYNRERARRNDRFRLFYQDAWQVRPSFTFNYGLAWHTEDGLRNYDLDKPEYLRPILGGTNADLTPPPREFKLFAPAIGFAWSLGNEKKTVIRGGSGIYYDSDLGYTRIQERRLLGPSGNGLVLVAGTGIPNPLCPTLPCPAGLTQFLNVPALPATGTPMTAQQLVSLISQIKATEAARLGNAKDISIRNIEIFKTNGIGAGIFDHDTRTPYTIHATFGMQREVARNMVVSADFVMRRGVAFGGPHGFFEIDNNRFNRARVTATDPITQVVTFVQNPIIPQCTVAQRADPKAQCSNGTLTVAMSASNSRYVALNVKLDKRFSNRYQFTASYALSRYTSSNPTPLGGVT
ncbi:MAG: carboxypeptidase regulatory-like domain-containing protein, partial [Blastocatellia bacterium]